MSHLSWIAIVVVLGAGCGGRACPTGASTGPSTSTDPVVARTMEQERVTCACKTLACAATAETDMKSWVNDHHEQVAKTLADPVREGQIDAHKGRTDACHQTLYDAATPAERQAADPDPVVETLATMSRYADRLCECKDRACVSQVLAEISKLEPPKVQPSKDQLSQAMAIAQRMSDCQRRVVGADPPPPTR